MTESTSNKPSHIVWFVRKLENREKPLWNRIGAAWEHQSGKGFNMQLEFIPTVEGEYVVLERKEQPQGEVQGSVEPSA